MKKNFLLCLLFIGCALVLCAVRLRRHAQTDMYNAKSYFSDNLWKKMVGSYSWLGSARIIRTGNLILLTPSETNRACLFILPTASPFNPMIIVEDNVFTNASRGVIQKITLIDSMHKMVEVDSKAMAGVFDYYLVTTADGASYDDQYFSGTFNFRFGPSEKEIMYSNSWHSYHFKGSNCVLEMEGGGQKTLTPGELDSLLRKRSFE